MAKVVTFGEIMLRLKSPAYERLFQSPTLEATFGGGEANVSVSLANYGMETAFVSVLPKGDIGDACIRELRGFGVDTTHIVRKDGRMGIYFLETGAVQRPSKVIYDRAGSAICEAGLNDIDWDKAFEGATWFHVTGITPAISEGAAELTLAAVKKAKEKGLSDPQYENMAALAKAALDYLYLATDAAKEKPNTIRAKVITKEPERREPQTVKVVIQEPKEPKHQEPEQWDKTAKFTVKGSNANDKE